MLDVIEEGLRHRGKTEGPQADCHGDQDHLDLVAAEVTIMLLLAILGVEVVASLT